MQIPQSDREGIQTFIIFAILMTKIQIIYDRQPCPNSYKLQLVILCDKLYYFGWCCLFTFQQLLIGKGGIYVKSYKFYKNILFTEDVGHKKYCLNNNSLWMGVGVPGPLYIF